MLELPDSRFADFATVGGPTLIAWAVPLLVLADRLGRDARVVTVLNAYDETFEHGLVKFHVRADSIPYAVDNGELLQTIVDGDVATCYVRLNILDDEITTVTINPTTGVPDSSVVLSARGRMPRPSNQSDHCSSIVPLMRIS